MKYGKRGFSTNRQQNNLDNEQEIAIKQKLSDTPQTISSTLFPNFYKEFRILFAIKLKKLPMISLHVVIIPRQRDCTLYLLEIQTRSDWNMIAFCQISSFGKHDFLDEMSKVNKSSYYNPLFKQ